MGGPCVPPSGICFGGAGGQHTSGAHQPPTLHSPSSAHSGLVPLVPEPLGALRLVPPTQGVGLTADAEAAAPRNGALMERPVRFRTHRRRIPAPVAVLLRE